MFSSPSTPSEPRRIVRILYAEDVRELRDIARLAFQRDGHVIECVEDGADALDRLEGHFDDFDLLITDHHMPRVNGLDLVRALRHSGFKGKIMVFSSELNPTIAAEYEAQHVDRILFKPVYPSFLRQTIDELFPARTPAPV